MVATTAPLPTLPIAFTSAASAPAPAGGSPMGRLVVSPASLGLGSFMQGASPTNSRSVTANNPMVVTQAPAEQNNICPSPTSAAVCGSTLTTRVAPVVQTVRQAGQRVRETPCVEMSFEKVHGYTLVAKEAATRAAAQSLTAADDVRQTIEPYLDTALTKYYLPACGAVREAHTEYVIPNVTRVRDTYNEQYHDQYVVPAVTKAGDLIGQAKTTYMESYHHQYVMPSVNSTVEVVGQLPQRLTASMSMWPQQPPSATSPTSAQQPE